ncbi:MAG: 2-oxo acid dehydrogenase subunit E2 [Microbacterium sp.]|uniref:dihydrolipoamide acetyltransferase family protein n=1 Tax=unclassified Microbacterium TaxID=2609290 RepID=UPI000DAF95C8|nr:dihydrolipoamide acetyltransferase family protein [Microbacterium sp.]PZU36857.1 MAG: 2-oxo acid dehydrogenase subunit E2 [Microbacterium sp.]
MTYTFALPDLGEGLTDAELVHWQVAVGEHVDLNQTIAEVETAKAVVELPSPCAGTVRELLADVGQTVPVGGGIITLDEDGEPVLDAGPDAGPAPHLVGYGAPASPAGRPHRRPRIPRPAEPPAPRTEQPAVAETRADERVPIRGLRRRTAEAMVRSAFTAPHVTTFLDVDVTRSVELVDALRADRSLSAHRIGILTVTARAVCLTLACHPELNASWDDAAGEIVRHTAVNLGIAVATERGLVVPVVRGADALALPALADAVDELARTAREGRTSPTAMTGGTFTISNIGVFGVDAGTPILNPGEAGILALGAVRRRPWEHGGEIALREIMTLSLSFDHRLVDGAEGGRFLADLGMLLTDPARAMLYA